ncbi:mycothiol synthase [Cellulomonas sp. KRMCY2]|uniref:mycothiol synthase n=1 Tax=Cellulomonas sp. KRMCY2 TaxID=1304865 RepID=UPI0004BC51D0|nr:mycothiol synthase [Cellulomonas sp. KRMCY2]
MAESDAAPGTRQITRRGLLPAVTADAVRALAVEVARADGVEAFGEQTLLNLLDPQVTVVHVLVTDAGAEPGLEPGAQPAELVGYAQVDLSVTGTCTAELAVAPRARGRGLGAALLTAVLDAARANGVERPAIWAHGHLPGATALATRAGLAVTRELWQMSLDLPGSPTGDDPTGDRPVPSPAPVPVPDDIVLRPFVVGQDEAAWLTVNARAFADHPEQGRLTRDDLAAREREPWFSADDLLLAERAGRLVASVWMKVEPGSDTGELYVLGVDPDAQGRGLGRLLTAATVDHLAARGLRRVVLYTSPQNAGAVRTYLAAGFETSRVDVQYR